MALKLKCVYESLDELPPSIDPRELFTERNGRFELSGVEGAKTQADVDRVQEALRKERSEHAEAREQLRTFDGFDPEEAQRLRDENEDLKLKVEAAGEGGKLDEKQIEETVERRLAARLRPVEHERDKLREDLEAATQENAGLKGADARRRVIDAVRAATTGEKGVKVVDTALADIELLAERVFEINADGRVVVRDQVGLTPGLTPRDWLLDLQAAGTRRHWFPGNVGAGASGGDAGPASGPNPFSGTKPNLTEIGRIVKADPNRAQRLAVAAKRLDLLPKELRPNP